MCLSLDFGFLVMMIVSRTSRITWQDLSRVPCSKLKAGEKPVAYMFA